MTVHHWQTKGRYRLKNPYTRGREGQTKFFTAWKVLKVCSKKYIKNYLFFWTSYSVINNLQTLWWIYEFVAILAIFPHIPLCPTSRNAARGSHKIQSSSPKTYTESGQDVGKKILLHALGLSPKNSAGVWLVVVVVVDGWIYYCL